MAEALTYTAFCSVPPIAAHIMKMVIALQHLASSMHCQCASHRHLSAVYAEEKSCKDEFLQSLQISILHGEELIPAMCVDRIAFKSG